MSTQQSNMQYPIQTINSIIGQVEKLDRLDDAEAECAKAKAEHGKWTKNIAALKQEFAEAKRLYDEYVATCQLNGDECDNAERKLTALNGEIQAKTAQLNGLTAELGKLHTKFFGVGT
jgi:chromosome segregation ATPase